MCLWRHTILSHINTDELLQLSYLTLNAFLLQGTPGPQCAPGVAGPEGAKGFRGRDGNPGTDGELGQPVSCCSRVCKM